MLHTEDVTLMQVAGLEVTVGNHRLSKGTCSDGLKLLVTFAFACCGAQRTFVTQSSFQELGRSTEEVIWVGIFKRVC